MKKIKKGFTLVELIVVMAIVGILAIVLIPNLYKYIKNAKITSANNTAKVIYDSLNYNAIELEANETIVSDFKLSSKISETDGKVVGVGCVDLSIWRNNLSSSQREIIKQKDGYIDIIYKGGRPVGVAWSSSSDSDAIVGRFPKMPVIEDGITWSNWSDVY